MRNFALRSSPHGDRACRIGGSHGFHRVREGHSQRDDAFYAAFNSALHSDLAPLSAVWSHRPDVTNLSAAGGHAIGWNEVHAGFLNMSRLYPGGSIEQRDMSVVVGKEMGYSVCIETGRLRSADGPMVTFNQRATNIFRLEGGTWKLIHHHADSNLHDLEGATR